MTGGGGSGMALKVFVRSDMEGISGIVYWPRPQLGGRDGPDDERQRLAMADDINAAIRGAWEAGAREFVVAATHGSAPPRPNLIPGSIDERAHVFQGTFAVKGIVELVDGGYDLAFLIGLHAMNGVADGILSHTFNSTYRGVWLNGRPIGEIGVDALIFGAHGIPVGLVTGDQAAVDEALELLGGVEVYSTKTGLAHGLGVLEPPAVTLAGIEAAARRAVARRAEFTPYRVAGPYRFEVELGSPFAVRAADACELVPGVQRLSGTRIAFARNDVLEAIRLLRALLVLAGTQTQEP